jgi:hypothetical protein
MQRSIHSSTEGSPGLRNRSAPGPACFGPGNLGVTLETGQTAMQVAQRIQTSELLLGQLSFSNAMIQPYLLPVESCRLKFQIPNHKSQTSFKSQFPMTQMISFRRLGFGPLRFIWDLVLGFWCLSPVQILAA